MLAANSSALKNVGSVDIKMKMKPKSGEFAQEFLITTDNCLTCLLRLDFMVDQECILNNGEKLLYSTKHRIALPISAHTTTGVRIFVIAKRNARIPSEIKKTSRNRHRG